MTSSAPTSSDAQLIAYLNLKLREIGQPGIAQAEDDGLAPLLEHFIAVSRQKDRALVRHLSPVDRRIQDFLHAYIGDVAPVPSIPATTLVLDRAGLSRVLSIPVAADKHQSDILTSFRVKQGVLHNPKSDRRTTKGIFHVAEGGLPIPDDKKAVPISVFAKILAIALQPPADSCILPFAAGEPEPAKALVSLHLRPVVCPSIPGFTAKRSMETRFFAPGSLMANLDFVERIFGNGGDPFLPDNDAALDPEHWTGHTGCVVLAPHVNGLKKKDLGLPHFDDATERQKRDGMCWKDASEDYNDGTAFKITARDANGVIVTVISDNYFGYCKKEIKTQISFATNLLGRTEEEHAGGAVAMPSYDLGEDFQLSSYTKVVDHTLADALKLLGERAELQPGGWAQDVQYPYIYYVPGDARFDLRDQSITWKTEDENTFSLKLLPGRAYVLPSGYKVEMVRPADGRRWRLRGTTAEGLLCHKPCTVSGGGKSEISKSIADATFTGPVFVSEITADLDLVETILAKEYGNRFRDDSRNRPRGRPILSPDRSLGSVVKLLSRSPDYTDEYNEWLGSIPRYIRDLVLILKRLHKPSWGPDWRKRFSVDTINGRPGNELKYQGQKLLTHYLRIGFTKDGSWRTFGLRKDFLPAVKIQAEDDITVSAVAPHAALSGLPTTLPADAPSVKFVHNCEKQLFQRPDEAIHRGYDKATERDFSRPGNFFSNYEPLTADQAQTIVEDTLNFEAFTPPVQKIFHDFLNEPGPAFLASPAHPRIVDGKPSKNPRYLQVRPDLEDPRATYLGRMGSRLYRRVALDQPAFYPVGAVLVGRRQNPPEPGVRPLCAYGPIHYQELPEAFMEFIASLTGKSPSTTGAGSEGAMTKGPFNALPPIYDLNTALVSYLLTGLPIFSSAAGWVGPNYRVDHDISLLVPEIWCRMVPAERDANYLIEKGYLEPVKDMNIGGKTVLASRLGYRITERFVQTFCGRVLANPSSLFPDDMLRPELQDEAIFSDSIDNIMEANRAASERYFADGSVDLAIPPLKALLHIMRDGNWEGHDLHDPVVRQLFDAQTVLTSAWYQARLAAQKTMDVHAWRKHVAYLESFAGLSHYADVVARLAIPERLTQAKAELARAEAGDYTTELVGTLGVDPSLAAALS